MNKKIDNNGILLGMVRAGSQEQSVLKTFYFMMYNGEKFNAFNFELNLL